VDFDQSLNKAVNRLREALGDSADSPRFIETLPRRGYRFIGRLRSDGLDPYASDVAALSNPIVQPVAAMQWPARPASDWEVPSSPGRYAVARPKGRRRLVSTVIAILSAAVLTAVAFKWLSHSRIPNLAGVQISRLTDSGRAHDVAISPDGSYVVYSLSDGETQSLRLRQIATGSDLEIVAPGPRFHGLIISVDGSYVYFTRSDPKEPYFKYLYSVPLLGGPVRKMIADVDSPVAFSPNGQQFAFERAVVRRNVIEIRIANVDGSGEHVIATIPNGDAGLFQPGPSWSRDGRTIVCPFRILDKESRWILASVSVPNGVVREIYADSAAFGRPVWLSDENLLVPRYDTAYQRWQLWTISYPKGKAERFTNDLADYDQPLDIARDRNTLVAVVSTVISNIWESTADNPLSARQITLGGPPMLSIAETADGRLLSSGADGQIWMVKSNGQREAFGDFHRVSWLGMCGGIILFTSFEAKAVTLTRVNQDGSHLLKLVTGDLAYPGCSPDGKFAYYVNRHRPQRVWRISTEGGSPVEIGSGMGEGVSSSLRVSPDGKLLSFSFIQHCPNEWKLAVIPASGGSAIKIFDVPGGTNKVRWSSTGTALQYLVNQNRATNIWEQSLVGGEPKQLTKFTSGLIFDFDWSSHHERLLLTRGDIASDVVLLSNIR
jgi:Tol biopolymer transport system component